MKVNMEKISQYNTRIRSAILMLCALIDNDGYIPRINERGISSIELFAYINMNHDQFVVLMNELVNECLIVYVARSGFETIILNPDLFMDNENDMLANYLRNFLFNGSNATELFGKDKSLSSLKKIRKNMNNAIRKLG